MKFELTREYIEKLEDLIEEKNSSEVKIQIDDLHPADIAEMMEDLTTEQATFILMLLDGETASDVLVEIPENDRRRFLKLLPPDVIASKFIEFMNSDDAADRDRLRSGS